MRLPDGDTLLHAGQPYDPVKAHDYYMRVRQLKGRKKVDKASAAHPLPVEHPKVPPKPKGISAKSADKKLASIRAKLDLLKRQAHQGPGDFQKRTAEEKSAAAKKAASAQKAAADEAKTASTELASMNQALKMKMAQHAPASEITALQQSVKDAKGKLDEAVAKLRDLHKAT